MTVNIMIKVSMGTILNSDFLIMIVSPVSSETVKINGL